MAEILLARVPGPRTFERLVAIKRILPHLAADRAFVDMFIREAQIAASIRHARVAQVHELACVDGEYLLVMEYVEGESLGGLMRRLWLRGESLDRVLGAHIIAEACAGLHAAHERTDARGAGREVVHRDVSPQNVMITYAGEVKVLDFGIAKELDTAITRDGQIKGKYEYMSPEQCRGEPVDRRSDIFSLGVVLYELTCARRLFKRDSAMRVFQAICDEPIPLPTEVDAGYPAVLQAICARALARDRRDRYTTMLEMRRDLLAGIRRLSGTERRDGDDEALAAQMSRVFADRVAEKRDLLNAGPGRPGAGRVPAAEADPQVELPEVPRPTPSGMGLERIHARVARTPAAWLRGSAAAAAAMMVAGLGGAAVWGRLAAPPEPGPATARPRLVDVLAAPARVAGPPASVSRAGETSAPGAAVFVDGEPRGRAPCAIAIARGDRPVSVAISHDGFRAVTEPVVPSQDQRLVIHLQPIAGTDASRPRRGRLAATPEAAPAVFERFE